MRGVPQTPTRRSKRGQPIVTFPTRLSEQSEGIKWSGEQIHVRPMQPELDMLPERLQLWQEQEEEERRDYDAVFYNSFQQETRGSQPATFSVGQTVAVSTQALYKRDKAPSIAVIIAMWELLAAIRVKREHGENEIYYSTTSSEILIPSAISASCTVTSDSAPRRRWAYAEDNKKIGPFYCRVAVDARRGLYYKFDWLAHHQQASTEAEDPWGSVETAQNTPSQTKTNAKRRASRPSSGLALNALSGSRSRPMRWTTWMSMVAQTTIRTTKNTLRTATATRTKTTTCCLHSTILDPTAARATLTSPKHRLRSAGATWLIRHHTPKLPSRGASKGTSASPRKRAKIAVRSNNASLGCDSTADLPKDPWLRAMHVLHVGSRPDALPCRETEFDNVLDAVSNILEEGSGGCVCAHLGRPRTGKTATVHAVVRELKRMAESNPTAAYTLLWEAVSGHDATTEGSLRMSAKESLKALTTHFSGGGGRGRGPGGHACVVLMDELDQLMTAKQDVVYNFFNWPTLVGSKLLQTIVEARLASAAGEQDEDAGEVLQKDAIKLKLHEVRQAAYLRECSFHERMMLAALVKCIKREGVDEIKWGEVKYQHLTYVKVIEDPTVRTLREPTPNELALGGATALRKAEGDRKVILNLEQGEVERVLGDVGGEKWRNILTS
ncbi:hypothetical protein C8J57DRAFT_1286799 [Mycena rebaudengoi]|nr:hypothetical protein C8J57DRAFT_1286799 [Mycena rebaudengoi]